MVGRSIQIEILGGIPGCQARDSRPLYLSQHHSGVLGRAGNEPDLWNWGCSSMSTTMSILETKEVARMRQ